MQAVIRFIWSLDGLWWMCGMALHVVWCWDKAGQKVIDDISLRLVWRSAETASYVAVNGSEQVCFGKVNLHTSQWENWLQKWVTKNLIFSESDWELLQIFVFLGLVASRFNLTTQQLKRSSITLQAECETMKPFSCFELCMHSSLPGIWLQEK